MILHVTIHGHGIYGDVRSMSHEGWRLNGKKSGMCHYVPGATKGKSGVGKGERGRAKKPSGDGPACAYLDPMESWRFDSHNLRFALKRQRIVVNSVAMLDL